MESCLHSIPQSNHVEQRWRLWASGPSCHHVSRLVHSVSFPTSRKILNSMPSLSTANTQVKTLFSHSDHFTIMLWFLWWNCMCWKKKQPKAHGGMQFPFQGMIWWSLLPSPPKNPVRAQSTSAPLPLLLFIIKHVLSAVWKVLLLSQLYTLTS